MTIATGEFQVSADYFRLWNGSWADDSVRRDEVNRVAYEPSRIKKIEHNGKRHRKFERWRIC